MEERMRAIFVAITLCLTLIVTSGCSTIKSATGMHESQCASADGAGMGALLGQTGGGSATGAAPTPEQAMEEHTRPLANTTWQVVSVTPKPPESIRSKTVRFNAHGTLTTTTAYWDGRTVTDTDSERFRVMGQTLIISQDDWTIRGTFQVEGDSLYVDTGRYTIVLERLLTVAYTAGRR
jgi:hypothetical protein